MPRQEMLLEDQRRQLVDNWRESEKARMRDGNTPDHKPVVKLFTPWAGATWLLSELDPNNPDLAFGLCDLGQGFVELGHVSLAELRELRGAGGLYVERDIHFEARNKGIGEYAREGREAGRIIA